MWPVMVVFGIVELFLLPVGYAMYSISPTSVAMVVFIILMLVLPAGAAVIMWMEYLEENRMEALWGRYKVTVENKCCKGMNMIYTKEYPDLIFYVSDIDFMRMKIGDSYTLYSCVEGGYGCRTVVDKP
jgi:hypothetical protein